MGVISLLIWLLFQAAQAVQPPGMPEAPGVYLRQGDSGWNCLRPAVDSNANATGIQLFVDTGGYTDLGQSVTLSGSRASTRVPFPKPVFYVRAVGSAKDAAIVRLKQKKNSREYKTSFSNVTVQNKGGFRKEDLYKLTSQVFPDGSFSVSPENDLGRGEYLLVLGNAVPTYDFGVDGGE